MAGARSIPNDFAPAEDQRVLGLEGDWKRNEWPVSIELGYQRGEASGSSNGFSPVTGFFGNTAESTFDELYLGMRKEFTLEESWHPFLGLGLTYLMAGATVDTSFDLFPQSSDSDRSLGAYGHTGIAVDLTQQLAVGIDLRMVLGTEGALFGIPGDADYWQVAVFLHGTIAR